MIREKYIEERWPRYFVFGSSKDGKVDVASTHHDAIASVTPAEAELLIKERDELIDVLVRIGNGETLEQIMYG